MKHAIVILFLFAGISAADDAESKKLLKDLEGSYKMTSMERAGEAAPADFLPSVEKITIKGDKFSITFKGEDAKVATIAVDATKKPAFIDMKPDQGTKKDETGLGIIIIEGDTVKICFNDASNPKRPAEFKTTKDEKTILLTMKKMK